MPDNIDTPAREVLDKSLSEASDSLDSAAEGAVGERLTSVQQGAVRDYIEAQRAALEAQVKALEHLAAAFTEGDEA